ncbi:MAG TPA: glycosyltransferase, partial [Edaphobacter sp.]
MRTAFWLSFAVIAYAYAGYPIVMALLARFARRPWRMESFSGTVSIVMAVHNGVERLRAQVEHLASIAPAHVTEIIVVSDGSTDGTAELLAELEVPRLRPIVLPQQVGKASALNHGIGAASGEILLFMDIRPRAASGAVEHLLANFGDATVGCVAGELVLSSEGHDAASSAVSGVYWRYEQWIRNCEAAFDSPVGVYGGFYAARRVLVRPYPDGLILDDMFQPLSIIRQGYRSVLDREAIVHDVWPGKVAGEFARKVRT